MWIGTKDGLNKYDGYKLTVYKHDPGNPKSLSNNIVTALYQDKSGVLWIATEGGGLNRFDREKDGLPNDVVYGILEDDHNNLWLNTNKGLFKFNPAAKTFENYDTKDGLQSNEFNTNAYLKTRDDEMLFGGINGFNIFHPDSIKSNLFPPPIVLMISKYLINRYPLVILKMLESQF